MSMKPDIRKKINNPNPKKVKDLHLDNGRLSTVPFQVEEYTNLKSFSLFNNKIKELPQFFENYDHLVNLNLSNNRS
jgi:Leucine-rich repeat (LRR) protein